MSQQRTRELRSEPYDAESLLGVAVRVFTERGYDSTSMEQLAQAAGITKSAFYHHVSGKEDLLRLSLNRALDALFAVLADAESTEGRAVDQLEHVLRSSVRVLAEELPYVTLLLRVRGNTPLERRALERRREFDAAVSELVRQACKDGDLRPGVDPVLTSKLLFGMVNSVVEWYRPTGHLSVPELADAVIELAFQGLRVKR
jgi:AcrR family transcriptional regulator